MKAYFLSLSFCFVIIFSACKKTALVNGKTTSAKSGETTQVELNACVQKNYEGDNLNLCLETLQDSRCPSNLVCVWAGVAKASFTLTINGAPHNIVLATSKSFDDSTEVTVQHYKISLLNVLPYPDGTTPAKRAAEVRITKL